MILYFERIKIKETKSICILMINHYRFGEHTKCVVPFIPIGIRCKVKAMYILTISSHFFQIVKWVDEYH